MFQIERVSLIVGVGLLIPALFQNCAANYGFKGPGEGAIALSCGDSSCETTPLTTKPTVTTILLALGDKAKSQLVANPVSTKFLAETVIRYSSPQVDPKILIVRAKDTMGESPEDTIYIQDLLSRYHTTMINEPATGLLPSQVKDFDLIWFHNPGYPFSLKVSYETLLAFPGAVVLQGDDLTQGAGFSLTPLTGMKFLDNGTSIKCGNKTYSTDNNGGEQFKVSLDPTKIQGIDQSAVSFFYGNDIDNSVVASSDVEVLALATGAPQGCTEARPTVVRRIKQ